MPMTTAEMDQAYDNYTQAWESLGDNPDQGRMSRDRFAIILRRLDNDPDPARKQRFLQLCTVEGCEKIKAENEEACQELFRHFTITD